MPSLRKGRLDWEQMLDGVATLYLAGAHCGAYLGALGLTSFILWSLNRPLRPLGASFAAVVNSTFARTVLPVLPLGRPVERL